MPLARRTFLLGVASTCACSPALAQDYPSKPVRMIVPYAPGGATDILGRLLAARIDQELKQSVVIDNRGGGASQVGTQASRRLRPMATPSA
jgi:tripartite-type tricarboxylate transporter receptor subunit TctC